MDASTTPFSEFRANDPRERGPMNETAIGFRIAPEVARGGIVGAHSLLLGVDQHAPAALGAEALVDEIVARFRPRAVRDLIAADPVLEGFRELHRRFGVPTRKLHSAAESLARAVERRGDLPRILPIVDVYNAISLETGLALGAHDAERIAGNVSLRLTNGTEGFHPVGAGSPEPIRAGEYAYVDDANDVICRLEARQVEKTKVTTATRDLFLIVQGNPATPPETVRAGHDLLVSVLIRFFGGCSVPLHLP